MALRHDSKVDVIKQVPLFSQCSRGELRKVASIADEIDVREGRELTREGETGREFFVLLDGEAEVRRNGRRISKLGPGDFFGEIALVVDRPRTATVKTTTPARTLVITKGAFKRLLRDSPGVQLKVLQALAERIAGD